MRRSPSSTVNPNSGDISGSTTMMRKKRRRNPDFIKLRNCLVIFFMMVVAKLSAFYLFEISFIADSLNTNSNTSKNAQNYYDTTNYSTDSTISSVVSGILSGDDDIAVHSSWYSSTKALQKYECGKDDIIPGNTYTVCNGLSNQILGHVAHIANFIKKERKVAIPDAFIVNGVQSEKKKNGSALKNVIPTKDNSIPLTAVIDADALMKMIHRLGGEACFIPHDMVVMDDAQEQKTKHVKRSWLNQLRRSDDEIALHLLESMKPSRSLLGIVESVISNIENMSLNISLSDGVCLHHRDGPDWHQHCSIWEGNNCMNAENMPLEELVQYRLPDAYPKKWIYYIGDTIPSQTMLADLLLLHRDKDELADNTAIGELVGDQRPSVEKYRDIYAAVDFFVCKRLPSFIGNSVSTFSATQIALRRGTNSSWYNSRSIPLLAGFLKVETIPFVYTYTEKSETMGKILLKASITSVRQSFGFDIDINVIYHGTEDEMFLKWLVERKVTVHKHEPKWLGMIRDLQSNGNINHSHLYAHSGNYIGTWQRIDIPLFINAEYIMFLDYDTIVHDRFGLDSFGNDITPGIAFSAEVIETQKKPINAGVALMNVPKLRETYTDFLAFIKVHAEKEKNFELGPSDQGAYLDFYHSYKNGVNEKDKKEYVKYLDVTFNVKPYYKKMDTFKNRKIIHYHGIKPHDIFKAFMGYRVRDFPPALRKHILPRMFDGKNKHLLCLTLRDFALSIIDDEDNMKHFCAIGFPNVAKGEMACKIILEKLSEADEVFDCEGLMADIGYHKHSSIIKLEGGESQKI